MFDTYVTIVGNVMTAPDWRRTTQTNSLVAKFKVASTARRLDRETGRWIDGNSLRVRVTCWRKLAEGVSASVMVGDPIIVVGRLYTRDWTDGEGNHRTLYEMEAVAVGHDLARGRGRFARNRAVMATSAVEDAEADTRVRGEATEAVPADEAPTHFGDHTLDDPDFSDAPISPAPGYDALAEMRGGGGFGEDTSEDTSSDVSEDADDDLDPDDPGSPGSGELDALPGDGAEPDPVVLDPAASAETGRARRGRGRTPVPA
ncbi:single-stranded DNA-binding protein [Phytohabitans rumicis]|uniref:Single-stranded DNA-binding protein n=1 Tax=Phytohabitans rumicis TaxID=1076125 RepID=A0A6V8L6N9_9ACTN|nr:single-stranded DNA-binding protein [Phytohabitans rumicis]GFJ91914.1 hypothetical protein Prum_055560 [Phytohabitans rumicis]